MYKYPDYDFNSKEHSSFSRFHFKIMKARGVSFFLLCLLCCISAVSVHAQKTDPTPEATPAPSPAASPEAHPAPKSTPLAGLVEGTENTHIESKIQSYRSVTEITRNIADDIYQFNPSAKTFILYRGEDYKTWQNYRLNKNRLENQMKTLGCNYEIWISLAKTAFEKVPPGENPPQREILTDISENCAPVKELARETPEVKAFEQIVTYQDDFLKKYPETQKQIAELKEQNERLTQTVEQLRFTRITGNSQRSATKSSRGGIQSVDILPPAANIPAPQISLSEEKNDDGGAVKAFGTFVGAAAGFVSPVASLVGTGIDLIGYFRSDLKFSGSPVTIKDTVARSNIANALRIRYCSETEFNSVENPEKPFDNRADRREVVQIASRKSSVISFDSKCEVAVYDPNLFTPDIVFNGKFSNGTGLETETTLPEGIKWMSDLNEQREKARVAITAYDYLTAKNKGYAAQITAINASIAADDVLIKDYTALLVTLIEKIKDNQNGLTETAASEIADLIKKTKESRKAKVDKIKEITTESKAYEIPKHLEFIVENLKAINTSFDKFNDIFTKINDTSGLSPQMIYERAARLDAMFGNDQETNAAYWLDINALEMEGNTRVRKNLFRYFYYPDISHNGGSIVQFALSDPSGRVLLANTEDRLMKYRKSSNVAKPQ